jgi:thiamine-phosphate pyrophosphorylase
MIYFVTNRKLIEEDKYINHIKEVSKYVDYVIFREKDLDEDSAYKLVLDIIKVMDKKKLIINSFYNIANDIDCYGVHLPYKSFLENNSKVSNNIRIGVSIHSEEEVKVLNEFNNIDYLLYGHIFKSQCKEGLEPRGLEKLRVIKHISKLPVVPIGGINGDNFGRIKELGISDVGIMSYAYGEGLKHLEAGVFK